MKTAEQKWQREYEKKLEDEKSEAEKLAKMSADERAKAEFEKEKTKFEQDRAQFNRDRLELETVKELVKNVMENVYPKLGVKLTVDVASGDNWGDL